MTDGKLSKLFSSVLQ
uniref:Uncharacterized protein n=1 Tax=Anguilla anguilla TaxID=7936 RepID=A0A0E9USJ8_ANGAN